MTHYGFGVSKWQPLGSKQHLRVVRSLLLQTVENAVISPLCLSFCWSVYSASFHQVRNAFWCTNKTHVRIVACNPRGSSWRACNKIQCILFSFCACLNLAAILRALLHELQLPCLNLHSWTWSLVCAIDAPFSIFVGQMLRAHSKKECVH